MKYFLCVYFLLISTVSVAQRKQNKAIAPGHYYFSFQQDLVGYSLDLKSDSSFVFTESSDLYQKRGSGRWHLKGTTLVLNSKYQPGPVNLKVQEEIVEGDSITFDPLEDLRGESIPLALLFVNGDTTKFYDLLAKDFKFKTGDLRSFGLTLHSLGSNSYVIKNLKANKFRIVVDRDDPITGYWYLTNHQLLITKQGLCNLENGKLDSAYFYGRMKPVCLSRQK